MKIIIDTNIFLDILLRRKEKYDYSSRLLDLCAKKKHYGFVTLNTITDLFYIIYKHTHDLEKTYQALGCVLDIVKVIPTSNEDVIKAFLKKSRDLEDCIIEMSAISCQIDAIITNNIKDYEGNEIKIYSAEEFINILK